LFTLEILPKLRVLKYLLLILLNWIEAGNI